MCSTIGVSRSASQNAANTGGFELEPSSSRPTLHWCFFFFLLKLLYAAPRQYHVDHNEKVPHFVPFGIHVVVLYNANFFPSKKLSSSFSNPGSIFSKTASTFNIQPGPLTRICKGIAPGFVCIACYRPVVLRKHSWAHMWNKPRSFLFRNFQKKSSNIFSRLAILLIKKTRNT